MDIEKEINENLNFLVLEVQKQVVDMKKVLLTLKITSPKKLLAREDYVDNLKTMLTNKSLKLLTLKQEKQIINRIAELITIINNLEKIGDFCENIVRQVDYYITNKSSIINIDFKSYIAIIEEALAKVAQGFFKGDIKLALSICQAEVSLDHLFADDFSGIIKKIKTDSNQAENYITSLFILRYLERIGDSLQNIGESIISSVVGSRIKINHYLALNQSINNLQDFDIENIGSETKSGCRIDKIKQKSEKAFEVIFKEGKKEKIYEEKKKLELWNKYFPGIVPKIIKYNEKNLNASILMEFLNGQNLKELVLLPQQEEHTVLRKQLFFTLRRIWNKSQILVKQQSSFLLQLKERFTDVSFIHPDLRFENTYIGDKQKIGIDELLEQAHLIETTVFYPFKVLTHGDFNIDNVIYNRIDNRIHFIDLHRSEYGDYVQDVSVFLVSNFRLPVFENTVRNNINDFIYDFYHFAKAYAKKNYDESFHVRLSLGLARSFITSTRFTTNKEFAKEMFNRGIYLLERICTHKITANNKFVFNEDVLYY